MGARSPHLEKFTIVKFLESEGNQTDEEDKFNRVDILVESDRGELIIFEIQNNRELSYFHRMLYGVSKVITDYIKIGQDYVVAFTIPTTCSSSLNVSRNCFSVQCLR